MSATRRHGGRGGDAERRRSKWLAWLLRHGGPEAGVAVDGRGWARTDEVLAAAPRRLGLDRAALARLAAGGGARFELSADGEWVRARHGHSLPVDAGAPAEPPARLWHGTAADRVGAIRREGLQPGGRRDVHLHETVAVARRVGARHGPPVLFEVDTACLAAHGVAPRRSGSGVWLVDRVPPACLRVADDPDA